VFSFCFCRYSFQISSAWLGPTKNPSCFRSAGFDPCFPDSNGTLQSDKCFISDPTFTVILWLSHHCITWAGDTANINQKSRNVLVRYDETWDKNYSTGHHFDITELGALNSNIQAWRLIVRNEKGWWLLQIGNISGTSNCEHLFQNYTVTDKNLY